MQGSWTELYKMLNSWVPLIRAVYDIVWCRAIRVTVSLLGPAVDTDSRGILFVSVSLDLIRDDCQ